MAFPVHRPRRLRADSRVREMIREVRLHPSRFIFPLFVLEGIKQPQAIQAMPGQFQWPLAEIDRPIEEALAAGVSSFLLFGVPQKKDYQASSARDPEGLVPKAIRRIKAAQASAHVVTDVCLCAYTDHGHCGVLDSDGQIRNDESLPLLSGMAVAHAQAGADMVAPSDMMDGRVGAIRAALDAKGLTQVPIMSYAAKYASSFYGPFREAAHSAPASGDRKGYQMDPANAREALWEMDLDLQEGADILMVKPAGPYLDILAAARQRFAVPLAAYQVSGEYAMIKAAAANGWLDERAAVLESLLAIHRAGADLILTYFAPQAARWVTSA